MSRFTGALMLRALAPSEVRAAGSGCAQYQVTEDFGYESDTLGPVVVPAGFVTDFASIPRAALWYIRDDDPGILFPSVVHDFLYAKESGARCDRAQADALLREAMATCGARADQRTLVYSAVRLAGGSHWKN